MFCTYGYICCELLQQCESSDEEQSESPDDQTSESTSASESKSTSNEKPTNEIAVDQDSSQSDASEQYSPGERKVIKSFIPYLAKCTQLKFL